MKEIQCLQNKIDMLKIDMLEEALSAYQSYNRVSNDKDMYLFMLGSYALCETAVEIMRELYADVEEKDMKIKFGKMDYPKFVKSVEPYQKNIFIDKPRLNRRRMPHFSHKRLDNPQF